MELDGRALAVLECLLRQAEQVVPRAALIAEAWPGSEAVFDSTVSKVMRRLRVALGDPHGSVLQTVYGEGYRIALPATLLPSAPPSPAQETSAGPRPEPPRAANGHAPTAPAFDTPRQPVMPQPPAEAPPESHAAWKTWLPWTVAAAATLVAGWLAWLLLHSSAAT